MKYAKHVLLTLSSLFLITGVCSAGPKPVTEIMHALDKMLEVRSNFSAKVKLVQQKEHQGTRQIELFYCRRDADNSFLMVTTFPENEKGNGYLRKGENFWQYMRNTRTFQHIGRDESIAGTDMMGGDFEKKKMVELYNPVKDSKGKEILTREVLGKTPVFKFEVIAKVKDVTYPKMIYYVRQENFLPMKIDNFSLSGALMSTNYFLKYTEIEGRYIVVKTITIDRFQKGNKTISELTGISIKPIENSTFTKAFLENLSK
jgi:outer membrane lipoprotein-sorting protein